MNVTSASGGQPRDPVEEMLGGGRWFGYVLLAAFGSVAVSIPAVVESHDWTNYCDPYNTPLGVGSLIAQGTLLVVAVGLLIRKARSIGVLGVLVCVPLLGLAGYWFGVVVTAGTPFHNWPACSN